MSFNSRTLGRVRLDGDGGCSRSGRSFNSRTLGRVRLSLADRVWKYTEVSIHAPWEGCDKSAKKPNNHGQFQFTHPGKGATKAKFILILTSSSFNSRTLGRVRLDTLSYQMTV